MPLGTSSSSSEDKSSSLICDCWHRKQRSLLCFLSNSKLQLQVFSLLLLSVLKVLLIFLREYFEKNKDPPREEVGFNPLDATSDDLLSDWLIRANHFAAGSLSSMTRTFPAFKGTISWKLTIQKTIRLQDRTVCTMEIFNSIMINNKNSPNMSS